MQTNIFYQFPIFHYTKFFLNALLWNGGSALDYAPRALAFASKYWLETKRIVFLFFLWRNFIVLLTITREKKAALCLGLLFLQLRHTCVILFSVVFRIVISNKDY